MFFVTEAGTRHVHLLGVTANPDGPGTMQVRRSRLVERLARARPAPLAVADPDDPATDGSEGPPPDVVLFPGVVQRGRKAVAERSGAVLALASAHWTDGCAVLEEDFPSPGPVPLVLRSYLDPLRGHALHAELVPRGEARCFGTFPDRWTGATTRGAVGTVTACSTLMPPSGAS